MRIEAFGAVADIVGRRVRVGWDVELDGGEQPSGIPRVRIRRKERDFEFPAPAAGDPFLVYDSAHFPPAGTEVTEVDLGQSLEGGVRTVAAAESVSRVVNGTAVEVLRRTRATTFDQGGRPVRRREEILDVQGAATGLDPGTPYYYELLCAPLPPTAPEDYRSVVTPTEVHRTGRAMYESLPTIYRRHDVTKAPPRTTGAIPEANGDAGQLRRFMDLFGSALDHLRSRADGLRGVHDVDAVDHRILPHLASWVGWDLSHGKPIPLQRHEIKYAAPLYRITGTIPGCTIWVKRLTGWDARIKEFWRNVLFSNDMGNPDDPEDRGSRTVDTSNAGLMSAVGRFEDDLDYTYDTGTGPDSRYAYNVIGVFVRPGQDDTAADVARKRSVLVSNASIFLPFNMRAVVVVEADTVTDVETASLGLTTTTDG